MILDTLERIGKYSQSIPFLDKVMDFLSKTDLTELEEGRIELSGSDLFVNVNFQKPQTRDRVPIEAHRKYLDIQIPISGDEVMGFVSNSFLGKPCVEYCDEKDVEFYPGPCDTYLNVRKGMFTVFYPGEGHAPAITDDGIRKIVIKIRQC